MLLFPTEPQCQRQRSKFINRKEHHKLCRGLSIWDCAVPQLNSLANRPNITTTVLLNHLGVKTKTDPRHCSMDLHHHRRLGRVLCNSLDPALFAMAAKLASVAAM